MEQNPQGGARTGTRDETYDLIAVVYHALQGAENCRTYSEDAQGQQELRQFFDRAREMQKQMADEGKRLLQEQIMRREGGAGGSREGSAFFGSSSSSSGMSSGSTGSMGQQGANAGASQMSDRSTDPNRNSQMTTGGGGTSTF